MTVNGVNNSNNNAGAYAAGAAVVGGAAGAATGYFTKNIVKDGKYTDEFLSQTSKNFLKSDDGKAIKAFVQLDPNSKTFVDDFCDVLIKHGKTLGIPESKLVKNDSGLIKLFVNENDPRELFTKIIDSLNEECGCDLKLGKDNNFAEVLNKKISGDVDEVYDVSKKAFKEGIDESDNIIKCVKKAISDVKWKAAGIYGGIAAAVLGLGTYLCCAGKKAPEAVPEQKVDAQA